MLDASAPWSPAASLAACTDTNLSNQVKRILSSKLCQLVWLKKPLEVLLACELCLPASLLLFLICDRLCCITLYRKYSDVSFIAG